MSSRIYLQYPEAKRRAIRPLVYAFLEGVKVVFLNVIELVLAKIAY